VRIDRHVEGARRRDELPDEGGTGGRSPVGVLLQEVEDAIREGEGDVLGEGGHGVVDVGERDVHLGGAGEGAASRSCLVGDDTQGVEVAGGGRRLTHGLLGWEVLGRAHHHAGSGEVGLVGGARDPEVGELHDPVGTDEDVRGLDVAVDHAGSGCSVECQGHLDDHRDQVLHRDTCAPAEVVGEGASLDEFHDDPAPAVLLPRVEDGGDVGVLDAHGIAGLDAQP